MLIPRWTIIVLWLLITSQVLICQESLLSKIQISVSDLSNPNLLKDEIKNVQILNVEHPSIKRGSYITFTIISEYIYVAVLGGKSLVRFTSDGKFDTVIQSEKSSPIDFISNIWNVGDMLLVYDTTLATIFTFDTTGTLIKKDKIEVSNPSSIISTDKTIWLDMNRRNIFGEGEPTRNNLLAYDSDLKFLGFKLPYRFSLPVSIGAGISNFSSVDGHIYYHQPHSKSIYELLDRDTKRIAEFDFDGLWPYDLVEQKGALSYEELMNIRNDPDQIFLVKSHVNEEFIFSQFHLSRNRYFSLYNRETGLKRIFQAPSLYKSFSVINWSENLLGMVSQKPDGRKEIIQDLGPDRVTEKFSNSSKEFTHSIIFIEFKDFD